MKRSERLQFQWNSEKSDIRFYGCDIKKYHKIEWNKQKESEKVIFKISVHHSLQKTRNIIMKKKTRENSDIC